MFISTIDFNNSTPEQLQIIGNQMGHHIAQQLLYKWKSQDTEDAQDAQDSQDKSSEDFDS